MDVDRRAFLAGVTAAMVASCSDQGESAAHLSAHEQSIGFALASAIVPGFAADDATFAWRLCEASLPAADRNLIQAGLAGLDEASRKLMDSQFVRLSASARAQIAALLDADTFKPNDADPDTAPARRFFELFKAIVIIAYFTSEAASRSRVAYDPVPGGFSPHVLVDDAYRNDLFDRGSVFLLPALRWANT